MAAMTPLDFTNTLPTMIVYNGVQFKAEYLADGTVFFNELILTRDEWFWCVQQALKTGKSVWYQPEAEVMAA